MIFSEINLYKIRYLKTKNIPLGKDISSDNLTEGFYEIVKVNSYAYEYNSLFYTA